MADVGAVVRPPLLSHSHSASGVSHFFFFPLFVMSSCSEPQATSHQEDEAQPRQLGPGDNAHVVPPVP